MYSKLMPIQFFLFCVCILLWKLGLCFFFRWYWRKVDVLWDFLLWFLMCFDFDFHYRKSFLVSYIYAWFLAYFSLLMWFRPRPKDLRVKNVVCENGEVPHIVWYLRDLDIVSSKIVLTVEYSQCISIYNLHKVTIYISLQALNSRKTFLITYTYVTVKNLSPIKNTVTLEYSPAKHF